MNIVAALEALYYLMSVPIHLAVRLNGARVGSGLSAFDRRGALRRARAALESGRKPNQKAPKARRALKVLLRLRIDRAELAGRVALGDAAATALLCGGITGLARTLSGRVGRLRVDVRPDFGAEAVAIELKGMIRARSGQIILATLQVWIEEEFPWISTRLKPS